MESEHNSQYSDLTESPKSSCKRIPSTVVENAMDVDIDIEEEEDDKEFDRLLWSIDDDTLFYPLGLMNHGTNAGKTVFVTWCEDYLLNFVFKRSQRTRRINLTKVRVPMPAGELIRDILILEMNALLLMHSGRVYYFSSVKSMHPIPWLNGIRCFATAPSGFSVIRLDAESNCLLLEVYRDVPDIGKSAPTLMQRCDITFDTQNLFNCQWLDEHFTLTTQQITEENLNFMKLLIWNEVTLVMQQFVHIFTVSGIVFALVTSAPNIVEFNDDVENVEYNIQQLCSFATNVDFINIDCAQKRCLVFLQNGSIDIWYATSCASLLQRMQHHTGSNYTHRVYAASTHCFYFTDEEQVAQLKFSYDPQTNSWNVQETFKAIPGILACTWVDTLQYLICLSCNNIFYKITFENTKALTNLAPNESTEYENLNTLYELTPGRMTRLLAHSNVINELEQVQAQLHIEIEQEYIKQQLIAVIFNQHIYRRIIKAVLSYTTQLPATFEQNSLLIYANANFCLHSKSLLAVIHLRINKNEIFHSGGTLWHLHIDYDGQTQLMYIPSTLLQQDLHIVLPLLRSEFQLLPDVNLRMYAAVKQEAEFLAIDIPIDLQINKRTYYELFTRYKRCAMISNDYDVPNLVKQFMMQITKTPVKDIFRDSTINTNKIIHSLKLPNGCRFSDVPKAFGLTLPEEMQHFNIFFMSDVVNFTKETEQCITLESEDVVALYYAKLHLMLNIPDLIYAKGQTNTDAQKALILELKCDLERISVVLLQMNEYIKDNESSLTLQWQQLKKMYTKLRSDFYKLCS